MLVLSMLSLTKEQSNSMVQSLMLIHSAPERTEVALVKGALVLFLKEVHKNNS